MLSEPVTALSSQVSIPTQQIASAEKGIQQPNEERSKGSEVAHLKEAVADTQSNLKSIRDVDLRFSVHQDSGDVMVSVIDQTTGDIIREIPASEILKLAARVEEMVGLMLDQKG